MTHFWTVSPYSHAGSKSVLPTHGSPMMSVWWPTSSSEGVTVCDDKQWNSGKTNLIYISLSSSFPKPNELSICLHRQLLSVTADSWVLTLLGFWAFGWLNSTIDFNIDFVLRLQFARFWDSAFISVLNFIFLLVFQSLLLPLLNLLFLGSLIYCICLTS